MVTKKNITSSLCVISLLIIYAASIIICVVNSDATIITVEVNNIPSENESVYQKRSQLLDLRTISDGSSDWTGTYIGEAINKTFFRTGAIIIEIGQADYPLGTVVAKISAFRGLYGTGFFTGNITDSGKVSLSGEVFSDIAGKFPMRYSWSIYLER